MTQVILDTHVLLWTIYDPDRLPDEISAIVKDPDHAILFSAVAIWEIAIKSALRRPDFNFVPTTVVSTAFAMGFAELPVSAAAAAQVATLPPVHKDPFDRLLVAQAIHEPAKLLTSDRILAQYSPLVLTFDAQ